jgi:hypothetical protein
MICAGDCIDEPPIFAGEQIHTVECGDGAYYVVWNDEATGDDYPGDIATLENSCFAVSGGEPVAPSSDTGDGGDRNVLCLSTDPKRLHRRPRAAGGAARCSPTGGHAAYGPGRRRDRHRAHRTGP